MKISKKKFNYGGYDIEIFSVSVFDAFTYVIKDENDRIVLESKSTHDDEASAYVRACMDINDELK